MLQEAVVSYGEHFAVYQLSSEQEGVYYARLIRFYGSPEASPPNEILLVKGVRKWIGSIKTPELLNALGEVIEARIHEREKVHQRFKGEPTNPENI